MPARLDELLTRAERGELVVRNPQLERRMRSLDSSVRRGSSAIVFAALLLAGLTLLDRNAALSYWLMGGSALPMLHALGFGRLRK
jgi:hypothetical protein